MIDNALQGRNQNKILSSVEASHQTSLELKTGYQACQQQFELQFFSQSEEEYNVQQAQMGIHCESYKKHRPEVHAMTAIHYNGGRRPWGPI